jgi:predicted ABC-type ATPase
MADRPRLIIAGGPNGAGKTTLSRRLITEYGVRYLGADEVAAQMGLGSTGGDAVRAGRLFIERIDEVLSRREEVLIESTLSGLSTIRIIHRFREQGYDVSIQFVFVGSADECIARIRGRVRRGGHHVPDDDVRRRFTRAIINFWNRYRVEADRWTLYYNGAGGLVRVAFGEHVEAVVIEPEELRRFAALREA